MTGRYYDRQGQALEMKQWSELFADPGYKVVRVQEVRIPGERSVKVSTVWLGIDHSFSSDESDPPVIFETMVFFPDDSWDDLYQERYSTEEQALAGHERAVAWCLERDWSGPDDEDPRCWIESCTCQGEEEHR